MMFIYSAASFLNLIYRHLVRRLKPKSISGYLSDRDSRYRDLANHHRRLQRLTRLVNQQLPQPLAQHCRAANVREDTLVLAVDSPAWASRLRFHAPQLLRAITRSESASIRKIRVLVSPGTGGSREPLQRRAKLSAAGARLIQETADSISDPELAGALLRLARRYKPR